MSDIDELEAEFEAMEKKAIVEVSRQPDAESMLIVREELEQRADHHRGQAWAWSYITAALFASGAIILPPTWLGLLALGAPTGFGVERAITHLRKYIKAKRALKKFLAAGAPHEDAQDW